MNIWRRLEKLESKNNRDEGAGIVIVFYHDGDPIEARDGEKSIIRDDNESAEDFETRIKHSFPQARVFLPAKNDCPPRIDVSFVTPDRFATGE